MKRRIFGGSLVGLIVVLGAVAGCRSVSSPPADRFEDISEGIRVLTRPLPGSMAALYDLRISSGGGLRLAVLAETGESGRMTVSESFGSAVAIAVWEEDGRTVVFDLREGCRLEGRTAARIFGLGELPLDRMVLLLGGRMPSASEDRVASGDRGRVEVRGGAWSAVAQLADDPWRVKRVEGEGFEVVLDRHSASVPGELKVTGTNGEWAELELVRLQWEIVGELAPLPDLPACD